MIIEVCYSNPDNDLFLYPDKKQAATTEKVVEDKIEQIYVLCYTDGDFMATSKMPDEIVEKFIGMKKILTDPDEQKLILNEEATKDLALKKVLDHYGL